jgi:enoyl-CoA hydratase/carnithine racemase
VPDADLMAEAQATAARLAALPPLSARAMKRVLTQAAGHIDRALDLETEATIACFLDPETTRRITAF